MRPIYRLRQLMSNLRARSDPALLAKAAEVLTPEQLLLFRGMDPADQAHSIRVLQALRRRGESDPDILAAALLHDVGKSRHPLRLWERSMIVIVQTAFPQLAHRLGQGPPIGWRRAFVVAHQHPHWGAEMVAQVGGSGRLIELIAQHQNEPGANLTGELNRSLRALQSADNKN